MVGHSEVLSVLLSRRHWAMQSVNYPCTE